MFRSIERILDQKMDKSDLLRFGLVDGFDRADEPVFKPRVLLFDKSGQLRIGRCPKQRQYQRLEDCEDERSDQNKPQTGKGPSRNRGRVGEQKSDQERRDHYTKNPGQTSKPKKCLPSASNESDFPEQLFMWCHAMSPSVAPVFLGRCAPQDALYD